MANYSTMKMLSSTYIASRADYNTPVGAAIMSSSRIDKESEPFANILFDIKRRGVSNYLVDLLMKKNVVLLYSPKPLPKSFVVFAASDIKEDRKTKTFIDCSEMFNYVEGKYVCKDVDRFIAVLMDAFVCYVYYADETRFVNNSALLISGADCFVSLFDHILDYLRVNGLNENRKKIAYMTAMYFLCNQMCMDFNSSNTKNIAMKVSKCTPKEANIAEILLPKDDNHFQNIDVYIKHLSTVFKMNGLTTEVFVEKWLWQYGAATQFSLEYFPAFAALLCDAYSGTYINGQKTIEKQCGREMVNFASSINKVGNEVFRH